MTDYVLTLLGSADHPLPPELIARMQKELSVTRLEWRAPPLACDLYFSKAQLLPLRPEAAALNRLEQAVFYALDTVALALSVAVGESDAVFLYPDRKENNVHPLEKSVQASAEHAVEGLPFDAIVQPVDYRRKKLLICDMDSTMITCECIDELADFVGKKAEVSSITERAMNGELQFEEALRERVRLLAGLAESELQRCYEERVKMSKGAKELVQHMRKAGAHCVLVSGGFTFFTSRVAAELGFHEHQGNVLEVVNGKLTGKVLAPILGKEAKLQALQEQCTRLGILPQEALAIGDGANDLPMLLAAGLGVAYHAKPIVQRHARARLNYGSLDMLKWVVA